jgi:hypothetical protein
MHFYLAISEAAKGNPDGTLVAFVFGGILGIALGFYWGARTAFKRLGKAERRARADAANSIGIGRFFR